jgi:adenylate kinase family enzyme
MQEIKENTKTYIDNGMFFSEDICIKINNKSILHFDHELIINNDKSIKIRINYPTRVENQKFFLELLEEKADNLLTIGIANEYGSMIIKSFTNLRFTHIQEINNTFDVFFESTQKTIMLVDYGSENDNPIWKYKTND